MLYPCIKYTRLIGRQVLKQSCSYQSNQGDLQKPGQQSNKMPQAERRKPSDWLAKLPEITDGGNLRAEWMSHDQIPQLYRMIQLFGSDGLGVNPSDFGDEENFTNYMKPIIDEGLALCVWDREVEELILCLFGPPCVFCRSASPAVHSTYGLVHPRYAGKKLMPRIVGFFYTKAVEIGYLGVNTRVSIDNPPSYVFYSKVGMHVKGAVPVSFNSPAKGWASDLLVHVDYRPYIDKHSQFWKMNAEEVIKHALKTTKPFKLVSNANLRDVHSEIMLPDGEPMNLYSSSLPADIHKAFNIVDQAAKEADAFALDEAPSEEIFRSRFLNGKKLVMINVGKTLVGIAFLGNSYLTRSAGSPTGHIFLYLLPSFRQKGYGSKILRHLEQHAQNSGFSGAVVDVFVTSKMPYQFLRRHGYDCVGTIAFSGFVKDKGWTDTQVFYKEYSGAKFLSHLMLNRI